MAVSQFLTITTTPTKLVTGIWGNSAKNTSFSISVPAAGQTVYLGGPAVTSGTATPATAGYPITPGTSFQMDLISEDIWAVVAATTQQVNLIIIGQSAP